MDEIKTKQQVVEKIKEVGKILVTVSDNPSVDALSAALGLTMLLDKQQKYATAIFSGQTPPAIAFLEPEKTFDDTTDSLRDFIIALNKEKADHLRYKVEGDSVKIFITPYKTTISEEDLIFSQGDYNVELVIALGVDHQDNLDEALDNHGQILHDATIITMTAGDQTSTLGGIDWHDSNSSSLSEMVAGLAEAMKDDKKNPLLDGPIATALLTGIVAETDRFSNERTSSKVMTVAASLMAAGADQQLIATELQNGHQIQPAEGSDAQNLSDAAQKADDESKKDPSSLSVDHSGETLAELDKRVRGKDKAHQAPDEAPTTEETSTVPATAPVDAAPHSAYALPEDEQASEPMLGSALSATTEQAAEDARTAAENDQNKTILSHAYLSDTPAEATAPGSVGVNDVSPTANPTPQAAYALNDTPEQPAAPEVAPPEIAAPEPSAAPTAALAGERVIQPLYGAAQPDVAPALQPPATPAPTAAPGPTDLGLPLPPPLPDFSQGGAPPPPAIPLPPSPEQPAILGDILAPEASQQNTAPVFPAEPASEAPALPPVATMPQPVVDMPPLAPVGAPASAPANPGQFQIPGQPQ